MAVTTSWKKSPLGSTISSAFPSYFQSISYPIDWKSPASEGTAGRYMRKRQPETLRYVSWTKVPE